jgi:hypothetical protein
MRRGRLKARVINIPGGLTADPEGNVPHEIYKAINDHVADLVTRYP